MNNMMTFEPIPYHGNRMDASVDLAQQIADQWGVHPLMIQMARDITGQWRAKNRFEEAKAIQSWINRRVRYVPDPHGAEMLSDPLTTIQKGGDCDDQAILAAALLQAIGHDARFAAVTWKGRDAASHAVVMDLTARCVVDPISVPPDTWPPAPYEVQSLKFRNKEGQMQSMDGLFSKITHAIAKPIQKVFQPKTLIGKIFNTATLGVFDPSRNLGLLGRVADVAGTAATLAVGGYALGAASGATGGFWATSAAGGKLAATAAWKGLASLGGAAGSAIKAVAPAILMAGGGQGQQVVQASPQDAAIAQGQAAAWDQYGSGASGGSMAASGGGGGGGAFTLPDNTPGATVPVTDTMPQASAMPLVLVGVAAVGLVLLSRRSKRRA
jgi:predicted transglutaminase-like cysteine proteinase